MRVLVADDDAVTRRLLEVLLKSWGYEVLSVENGTLALNALLDPEPPQLAILDWMMPEIDGIDVCRLVRQQTSEPYVYIFLLTARDDKNDITRGLDAGADDYLTKPFSHQELQARLRAAIRVLELQAALIEAREKLRVEATHDGLTGLWNRPAILDALGRELARAKRIGTATTVVMADLDHFKHINDTFGHQAGDAVLREAARRLLAAARRYDTVGRYGGEEFLLVAPGCEDDAARGLAEKLRSRIADTPVDLGEQRVPVTISLGVASVSAGHLDSAAVIRAADLALYSAKAGGRNRAEFAPTSSQPAAE